MFCSCYCNLGPTLTTAPVWGRKRRTYSAVFGSSFLRKLENPLPRLYFAGKLAGQESYQVVLDMFAQLQFWHGRNSWVEGMFNPQATNYYLDTTHGRSNGSPRPVVPNWGLLDVRELQFPAALAIGRSVWN